MVREDPGSDIFECNNWGCIAHSCSNYTFMDESIPNGEFGCIRSVHAKLSIGGNLLSNLKSSVITEHRIRPAALELWEEP